MNTVKKSIFRLVTAAFASAVMLVTSIAPAFAANEYTTDTVKAWKISDDTAKGITMTDNGDGSFTSVRTLNGGDSTNGAAKYDAPITVTSGIAQVKYTVKFTEGGESKVKLLLDGMKNVGLRIATNAVAFVDYNDSFYTVGEFSAERNKPYDVILTVDMNNKELNARIYDGATEIYNQTKQYQSKDTVDNVADDWVPTGTDAKLTGVTFMSPRHDDKLLPEASSTWTVSDVEYDAFTEVNYEFSEMFNDAKWGVKANKQINENYLSESFELNALTNMNLPNAKAFTAAYVSGRLTDINKVDAVTSSVVPVANAAKAFVMDEVTARPYAKLFTFGEAPATTVRKIDFQSGTQLASKPDDININGLSEGAYRISKSGLNVWSIVTEADGNKALSMTRGDTRVNEAAFKSTHAQFNSETGMWEELASQSGSPAIYFDVNSKHVKISMRVKFDANETLHREIYLTPDAGAYHHLLLVYNPDGTVDVLNKTKQANSLTLGKWYTYEVDVVIADEANADGTYTCTSRATLYGDKTITGLNTGTIKAGSLTDDGKIKQLEIRSRRDGDYKFLYDTKTYDVAKIAKEQTKDQYKPLPWYLDDIKVTVY